MSGRLAAVIPAFDASPSVAEVVCGTLEHMEQVLVVDDGSTDDTGDRAREAGAEVIRHPVNMGKGAALKTAFAHLFAQGYDAVLTLDADGQHLPEEISKLEQGWIDGGDLVLGGREHLFAKMSKLRQRSNGISSGLISWVAGKPINDVQTGFRIYRRELIEATGFPESRFEAESAVIVRAARQGFSIVTVPIELGFADGRCTSHYRPIIDSVRIARAVIWARLRG